MESLSVIVSTVGSWVDFCWFILYSLNTDVKVLSRMENEWPWIVLRKQWIICAENWINLYIPHSYSDVVYIGGLTFYQSL